MYVAIGCLSALMRLEDDDLAGDLAEDLKHILDWAKRNLAKGAFQREPDEIELIRCCSSF
jgi:hypothetical protein